jgi:hypothetical protein
MKKAKTVLLVVLLAASIAIFLVPQKLQAVDPIIKPGIHIGLICCCPAPVIVSDCRCIYAPDPK